MTNNISKNFDANKANIVFALGSNLGNREFYLDLAGKILCQKLALNNVVISSKLANPPLLIANSPKSWDLEFINLVIAGNICLENFSPKTILTTIKEIETMLARTNTKTWAPRTIDIDILLIKNLILKDKDLTIPHYDLENRQFFLQPLTEIVPNWRELFLR